MHDSIRPHLENVWRRQIDALGEALTQTIQELNDLLRLHEYHLHGHDPAQLQQALGPFGESNLDLSALSNVLSEGTNSRALPDDRFERVQGLLKVLGEMKDFCAAPLDQYPSIEIDEEEAAIHQRAEEYFNRIATVFRALRIAQLEVRSKYQAEIHDPVFAQFTWRQLSPGELRLCPPFIVIARLAGDDQGDRLRKIMSLLESRRPIKIAALRTGLRKAYTSTSDPGVPATMAIEMLPLAMRGVSFLQACPATPDFAHRVSEALAAPRPGVISLLAPSEGEGDQAFRQRAERAVLSRAFPGCDYDPDRSRGFVGCFDLSANPSPEAAWISESFSVPDGEGGTREFSEPFTFAHFAAEEAEFASEFHDPDPAAPADQLTPIADYLELTRRQRVGKLPCLSVLGPEQKILTRVVSETIVTQTADRLHIWKTLQEITGIDNPHVHTTRKSLTEELGVQQQAHLEKVQREMEEDASRREQVAVAATVRKLVSHLTGVDASEVDLGTSAPAVKPARSAAP